MRVSSRRIEDIHGYLKIPPEIYIASMVIKLSDEVNVVFKEEPQYNIYEFIADMGGTAGVVLGIFRFDAFHCFIF